MPSEGPRTSPLASLLFPATPRRLPGHRGIKIVLRGLHTLAAGVLVGSHLLAADAADQSRWLTLTLVSGCLMLLLDLVESAAFLLQVRGVVLLFKLAIVVALAQLGSATGPILAAVFVLAVISSHAPSKLRYHVLVASDRVTGARTKG